MLSQMFRSFGRPDNNRFSGYSVSNSFAPFNEFELHFEERRSEGYDEFFDPPLESKYECPICLLGLRDPVQTSCGHRFCKECIKRSLRDAGNKCPVDNEPLLESQLYPDNFAKREMMAFTVCCRLKKERGCPWKGPLKDVQAHLDECPFADVECPNECGQKLQRQQLQQHQEVECTKRRVTCEHCGGTVPVADLKDHEGRCPKMQLTCESCATPGIPREQMAKHLEKVCPRVRAKCPFSITGCSFEGQRQEVDNHVKRELAGHAADLATAFRDWKQQQPQSISSEGAAAAPTRSRNAGATPGENMVSSDFQKLLDEISKKCDGNLRELDGIRRLANEQASFLAVLERRQEETRVRHDRQIQEIMHKLQRMETKMLEYEGRVCNGTYIWRIENFRQSRQDAVNNVMTAIHSPPFYTGLYGYKMCMRVNLNGVDTGLGRHVSLFVHMMQGDWDSILEWPFTGRITLSILDQSENVEFRRHISETLVAKPNLLAFQKPTAPRNHKGYGYVEFSQIEQLQEPQYIKNNIMLIRIQIFH